MLDAARLIGNATPKMQPAMASLLFYLPENLLEIL